MARESLNINRISPYNLDAIGAHQEQERGAKRALREAANEKVRQRIARIKSFGGHLNPYDLGQMADVLGVPTDNGWDH